MARKGKPIQAPGEGESLELSPFFFACPFYLFWTVRMSYAWGMRSYVVGLGDSPSLIAGTLSGNPSRYQELLAANPHKPIVHVGGHPTFQSLGVGERLNIPSGFIGDALAEGFGVGSHEEAFRRLAHSFGTGDPNVALARLAHSFGTVGADCSMNLVNWAGNHTGVGDSISGVGIARLPPGKSLTSGQFLMSPNRRAQLIMQTDGNLVLYDLASGHAALWGSMTNGKGGVRADMQSDGNFVVYNANHNPLWASGTDKHPGAFLAVQDDGNVVVYAGTQPLWSSKTDGFRKNLGGGGGDIFSDVSHAVNQVASTANTAVTKAVHDVSKATGLPGDQALALAKNAADAAQKAIASGAKLVQQAGGDAGKFITDRANAIAKDPLGSIAKIAATGPLALVGDPDDILKSLGIPTPDEMLKKIGLPPISIPDPASIANGITDPQALLSRIPGLSEVAKFLPAMPNPQNFTKEIMSAASTGDPDKIKSAVIDVGHHLSDSLAMVPGVGNALAAPLASAMSALEGGSPLRSVLELLLSQAPIPAEIKDVVLRPAIHGLTDIIEKHENVSDALISSFKEGIMTEVQKQGLPDPAPKLIGDLIDAMIQVILKSKPLDQAVAGFAKKGLDTAIAEATKKYGVPQLMPNIPGVPGGGLPIPGLPGSDAFAKINSLQKAYDSIKDVADKTNQIQQLTQGIIKLNKQDPSKKDPAAQKQIQDMKTSIEARKLHIQANNQVLNANVGARLPSHISPAAASVPPALQTVPASATPDGSSVPSTPAAPTPATAAPVPVQPPAPTAPVAPSATAPATPATVTPSMYGPYPTR